jgi:hypothetical protein
VASPNLDLVRSITAAWERADFSSTDWAHPDIEYVWVDGPAPGSWTGLAGMRGSFFGDFLNAWDKFRTDTAEYRELDAERVLVLVRWSGRGKTSGLELGETRSKGAFLFQVRDDNVTKLVCFFEGERAFADLGLLPGDDAAASA